MIPPLTIQQVPPTSYYTYEKENSIVSPSRLSSWVRGLPIAIEWNASNFPPESTFRIELCHVNSSATTLVAGEVENSGLFIYKRVPWGMNIGEGYYIRIVENKRRQVVTSPMFRIAK